MITELLRHRGLSLERLSTFEKVARFGNITAAAGGDSVTQSLYSRQIKDLESYFGAKLIEKSQGGIVLTPQGKRLQGHIGALFKGLSEFKDSCSNAPKRFVIHSGNTFFDWYLLPKLKELHNLHSDWKYTLLPLSTQEVFRNVETLNCDLGVMRNRETPEHFVKIKLTTYRYGLFLPPALLNRHRKNYAGIPFALHERGNFRRFVDFANEKYDLGIEVALECRSFMQALGALKTGRYATLLPLSVKTEVSCGKPMRPDWLKELDNEIVAVWNKRLEAIKPEVRRLAYDLRELVAGI